MLPASALAQGQNSDQQKCINSLYKSGAKIISAVAKDYSSCVSAAVDADLEGGQTAQECLSADNGGAVGKAKIGLVTASAKCAAVPSIGTSDATAAAVGFTRDPMRANDLFGASLDDALTLASIDRPGAACQEGVVASLGKLMKAKTKEFDRCVSDGMRAGTIDAPADVASCVGLDPSGKVQRMVDKTQLNIDKRCAGLTVADYFPGDCSTSAMGDLAECTANLLDCGICLTTLAAGGAAGDCDALDDGLNNNSCGPVWADTPDEYVAGPTSYISSVALPAVGPNGPECCNDFGVISRDFIENGTDNLDNALATLADTIGGFGFDLSTLLNDAIQTGTVSLLIDHPNLDTMDLPNTDLAVATVTSEWTNGTDYTSASAGNGEFLIDRSSFKSGTGEPLSVFYPSTFDAGVGGLQAGPATLNFPIPFGFVLLDLPISNVRITGDSTVLPNGIQYDNGEVGGYLLVDSFFEAVNQVLDSPLCDCLGHTSSIFSKDEDGAWVGDCVSEPEALCVEEEESVCATLAGDELASTQVCGLLPAFIASTADIDLQPEEEGEDKVYEGFSAGFYFSAVPATVVGVTP